jgi:hypothetical protein
MLARNGGSTNAPESAITASDFAMGRRRVPPFHIAAFWLVIGLVDVWFAGWGLIELVLAGPSKVDWTILTEGAHHVAAGLDPYSGTLFRWSPVAGWALIWITVLPFGLWALLHVAGALAMPSWPLRILTLVSWPFWQDLSNGNVVTLIVLAGAWALTGSAVGGAAFLGFALLIPRPIMLPLVVWLLWKHPRWRLWFVLAFIMHAGLVLVLDPNLAWVQKLVASGGDVSNDYNWGPSAIMGLWWLVIGVPAAVWLTWRGRIGWASLAISPYLLAYYYLFGLLEWRADHASLSPAIARRE